MRTEADSPPLHVPPFSTDPLKDALLVLGANLFIALSAQVAVRIPLSPVPITGQTFAVLLAGALLGSRRGALSVLAYLAEGTAGLPVFAGGGSGPLWLTGPTGGYLVGFVATAWVVGWLREHLGDGSITGTVVILLAGSATTYLLGLLWLARFVGPDGALAQGLLPFVPGDLIKMALATLVVSQSPRLTRACGSNIRM
jgi:biotin transport system substrate-specific component